MSIFRSGVSQLWAGLNSSGQPAKRFIALGYSISKSQVSSNGKQTDEDRGLKRKHSRQWYINRTKQIAVGIEQQRNVTRVTRLNCPFQFESGMHL